MNKDSWNDRYNRGEHINDAPHPLVVKIASHLTPGRALDLACGPGRHSLWLADCGWQVTAVDSSSAAIDTLQRRAAERNLKIDARLADLVRREFAIEPQSYDLILICNYLQRDLFPSIREGVRVGGAVIAVIAVVDDDPAIKSMNPAYLLNPGELRNEFSGWETLWDYEGKPSGERRRAAAELAAVKRIA